MERSCGSSVKRFFHSFLLPVKAMFFFEQASAGCMIPYIPIYLQQLGLNAAETAIIFGTLPFLSLVSKPSAGVLADKWHAPFRILRIFMLVQMIFTAVLYVVPKMTCENSPLPPNQTLSGSFAETTNNSVAFQINDSLERTSGEANWTLFSPGGLVLSDEFLHANQSDSFPQSRSRDVSEILPFDCKSDIKNEKVIRWTTTFWLAGLILLVAWYSYGAVNTLEDIITYRAVNCCPVQSSYGSNRAVGTIGFAVASLMIGFLLDGFSATASPDDRDFRSAFIAYVVFGCCGVIATMFLRRGSQGGVLVESGVMAKVPVAEEPDESEPYLMAEVVLFGLGTFIVGACTGLGFNYLAWYQSETGASNLLLGLTVFAQCAYEAPVMAMSGWIIRRIGHHACVFLALLSFALRFVGYYLFLAVNPWMVLLTETMHALGFGLFYSAITSFAHEHAPPEISGTLQGVIGATFEGFGLGLGSLAGGFLYHAYGGRSTWLGFGILALISSVVYLIVAFILWKKRTRLSPSVMTGVTLTESSDNKVTDSYS